MPNGKTTETAERPATVMITLRLDARRHQQLKRIAAEHGVSLNQYCLDRLDQAIEEEAKAGVV